MKHFCAVIRSSTGSVNPVPGMRDLFRVTSLLACVFVVASNEGFAEEPRAMPYRPTVSNPAYLPIPGYLELESGVRSLKAKKEEARRHSIPYRFKFGFSDRVGILIAGEFLTVEDPAGAPSEAGFGDVAGTLKLVQPLTTALPSALGLEAGVKFPSAPATVGSERTDYFVNGIYSAAFGPFGLDLNLLYTRLGGAPAGEEKDQIGWVTTASYAVTNRLSLAGEFFGSHREGVGPFLQYLTAASYFITPRIVGDAGMAFGLTGASQEWTAFAGVTVLLWRLL